MTRNVLIDLVCLLSSALTAAEPKAPTTVRTLWVDIDSHTDAFNPKLVWV